MRALPEEGKVIVEGVNVAKKHQRRDQGHHAGRHHRQGHADAGRRTSPSSARRTAPTRVGYRFDDQGTQGPHLQASAGTTSDDRHRDHASAPRLKAALRRASSARQLKDALGLGNIMEVPRLEKIVVNMGVGQATQQPSLLEGAVARPHRDHRPEAAGHQGQEVDRRLQAPRGQRHRRQGHAAGRPHVGVLRPAHQPRHPPHPRLPRPAARRASTAAATTRSVSPSS